MAIFIKNRGKRGFFSMIYIGILSVNQSVLLLPFSPFFFIFFLRSEGKRERAAGGGGVAGGAGGGDRRRCSVFSTSRRITVILVINPNDRNLRVALEIVGEVIVASLRAAETAMGTTAVAQLSQFVGAVLFFHGSEYALAVFFHGQSNVSLGSLLISKQYVIAMASALVEYLIEIVLFPGLKEHWWLSNIGLMMVLSGELIRKAAIITARRSFTHNIRVDYDEEHELITHGIYRFMRHPSYCGFFIWATGTQVMLCNPICIIAFTAVTWRFFTKRIPYEEFFLRQFFGPQYVGYAERVPSGLPFIK